MKLLRVVELPLKKQEPRQKNLDIFKPESWFIEKKAKWVFFQYLFLYENLTKINKKQERNYVFH